MLRFMLGSLGGAFEAVGAEDTMQVTAYKSRSAVYFSEVLEVLIADLGKGH